MYFSFKPENIGVFFNSFLHCGLWFFFPASDVWGHKWVMKLLFQNWRGRCVCSATWGVLFQQHQCDIRFYHEVYHFIIKDPIPKCETASSIGFNLLYKSIFSVGWGSVRKGNNPRMIHQITVKLTEKGVMQCALYFMYLPVVSLVLTIENLNISALIFPLKQGFYLNSINKCKWSISVLVLQFFWCKLPTECIKICVLPSWQK